MPAPLHTKCVRVYECCVAKHMTFAVEQKKKKLQQKLGSNEQSGKRLPRYKRKYSEILKDDMRSAGKLKMWNDMGEAGRRGGREAGDRENEKNDAYYKYSVPNQ